MSATTTQRIAIISKKLNDRVRQANIRIKCILLNLSPEQKEGIIEGMMNATKIPGENSNNDFAIVVDQIGLSNLELYPEPSAERVIEIEDSARPFITQLKANFQYVQRKLLEYAGLLNEQAGGGEEVDKRLEDLIEVWNELTEDVQIRSLLKKDGKFSLYRIEYLKRSKCDLPKEAEDWSVKELAKREEADKKDNRDVRTNSNIVPYAAIVQSCFTAEEADIIWSFYRLSGYANKEAAYQIANASVKTVKTYVKPKVDLSEMATLPMNYITKDKFRRIVAGGGCFDTVRNACDIPSLQYVVPDDALKALACLAGCLEEVRTGGLSEEDEFSFKHAISKTTTRVMAGLVIYNRNRTPTASIRIINRRTAKPGEAGLMVKNGSMQYGVK